jgi:hypothetical protein
VKEMDGRVDYSHRVTAAGGLAIASPFLLELETGNVTWKIHA